MAEAVVYFKDRQAWDEFHAKWKTKLARLMAEGKAEKLK